VCFLPEAEVIRFIEEKDEGSWLYLLVMESMLFSPYNAIFGDADKDKAVERLRCKSHGLSRGSFHSEEHRRVVRPVQDVLNLSDPSADPGVVGRQPDDRCRGKKGPAEVGGK